MRRTAIIAVAAGLTAGLLVGGGVAWAATSSKTVKVCVTSKNVVRSAGTSGKCPTKTKAVSINKVGPKGATGATGAKGAPGAPGPQGDPGVEVTTLNTVLPETATSTSVEVYDDPVLTIKVACTDASINLFYEGSQGDSFAGRETRVKNASGTITSDTTMNSSYSSSGFSAKSAVALDATITTVAGFSSHQIDVSVVRSDTTHCRVTGRVAQ